MEKELVEGKLGAVGHYDVKFVGGQLVAEAGASEGASSLSAVIKVDGKQVLDALIAKLPAGFPQDVAKMIESAILG